VAYGVGMVTYFSYVDYNSHSVSDTLMLFVLPFVIGTGALLIVCYKKGEKPRWRWGK
jgi:hypothetical protein